MMPSRRQALLAGASAFAARSFGASAQIDQKSVERLFLELERDENRDLKGVRVLSSGNVAAEAYFNGGGADKLHDIRSAGKSVTSLLVGLAIDRKLIGGVRVPVAQILRRAGNAQINRVTLEDLLTMRSGLAANDEDPESPGNENRLDQAASWVDFALSVPASEPAGRRYQYCSLNAFLAGACVEDAAGRPLDEFARQSLFEPLGIGRFEWRRGPQDRVAGQGNLRVTVPAMASIGQMCLQNGVVGSRQIISKQWIARSLASIVPIGHVDPFADHYGYMWYQKTHDVNGKAVGVHFASGNGGNKIYVVPGLRMVVAIASSAYGSRYGQRRSQGILKRILEAVRS